MPIYLAEEILGFSSSLLPSLRKVPILTLLRVTGKKRTKNGAAGSEERGTDGTAGPNFDVKRGRRTEERMAKAESARLRMNGILTNVEESARERKRE